MGKSVIEKEKKKRIDEKRQKKGRKRQVVEKNRARNRVWKLGKNMYTEAPRFIRRLDLVFHIRAEGWRVVFVI